MSERRFICCLCDAVYILLQFLCPPVHIFSSNAVRMHALGAHSVSHAQLRVHRNSKLFSFSKKSKAKVGNVSHTYIYVSA